MTVAGAVYPSAELWIGPFLKYPAAGHVHVDTDLKYPAWLTSRPAYPIRKGLPNRGSPRKMRLAKPECVCGRRPARVGGGTAGRMRARGFPPNHTGIPRGAPGAPLRGAGSAHPRRALGCAQGPDGRAAASSRHTRGRRACAAHACTCGSWLLQ